MMPSIVVPPRQEEKQLHAGKRSSRPARQATAEQAFYNEYGAAAIVTFSRLIMAVERMPEWFRHALARSGTYCPPRYSTATVNGAAEATGKQCRHVHAGTSISESSPPSVPIRSY